MTELLERERELTEIGAAIDDAGAGTGRLIAIEAPAGLGKTRLLQAARQTGAQAELVVLTARATELERDFPFALVRQLFEPCLTAMSAAEREPLFEGATAAHGALGLSDNGAQADADTFSVLHALYWLTATLAERQPLLLAIDDAHWADAASLDYLRFLLPRLEELPLLVVVACRPAEPETPASLAQVVTDPAAGRLTPAALTPAATGELLSTELGRPAAAEFAAACHEVSGGNPFLLCELTRTLAAEDIDPAADEARVVRELAPERVTRTVLGRVARLSPSAQALARSLVILGDDSDLRLVAALAEVDPDAAVQSADELRGAAILDAGAQPRFVHPLVRNALYSDLPAGERASAHARAAALLRGNGAASERIASHLVVTDAHGDRETVETLLEAGTRALASGAPQSAIAYLKRALREPAPLDLRAAVLDPLIIASIRGADPSVHAAIEQDVVAELERNPSLRTEWAARLTAWMIFSGRFDQAIALLERAIEVAVEEGDDERAFRVEAQLSMLVQRSPAETRAQLEPYRDRIEPESENGRLVAAFDAQWSALTGSAAVAAEHARRALAHEGLIFDESPTLAAAAGAVLVLIGADQLDDARRAADWSVAIARRRGGTPDMAAAWWLRGIVAWGRGDLVAAEADLRQALETMRLSGLLIVVPTFTGWLVDALVERGELDAAEAGLAAIGLAAGEIPDSLWFSMLLLGRGRLHLAAGRTEEAAVDLVELHARMQRGGLGESAMASVGAHLAMALAALGEGERARELAEAELVRARRWSAPPPISRALRALGLARGGAAGLERLREAVAVTAGSPAKLERAHALGDLGAALRRENLRAEAREPLREALALARRCGAGGLAKRAHDELQACGEKVRRYTPIGVESLTPSERRVAEMAASGMTNRQIAQTLFLTIKTIETHLSAAYDKLGIDSRRGLAHALGDAGT